MSDDNNSFLWFLAGLGVGAAVGVLYAPRSGSEMRETLRSKAGEGRDFVSERARKAREQASDLVDKGREVAKQQKEQFKSAYTRPPQRMVAHRRTCKFAPLRSAG